MKGIWLRVRANGTFFNILSAVLICVIIVTIVFAGSIFIILHNIEDYMHSANYKILREIALSVNYIDKSAYEYGRSMLTNISAKQLLYAKHQPQNDDEIITLVNGLDDLYRNSLMISYIYSVHIYNSTLDCYYSIPNSIFMPVSRSGSFFDSGLNSLIAGGKADMRLVPRRISFKNPNNNKYVSRNVYSYVYFDSLPAGRNRSDAIAVNLETEWLTGQINSMADKSSAYKGNTLFIMDKNGTIVNHPDENMFLKNIKNEKYIKRIINSRPGSPNWFIDTVDGKKTMVTYIRNSDMADSLPDNYVFLPDLFFISVMPYSGITGQLGPIRSIMAATCVSMLIIGILAAYILSRRVYKPIRNLVNNIRRLVSSDETGKRSKDDINFINDAFNITIQKYDELEKFKKSNVNILKQEVLREFLLDAPDDRAAAYSRFDALDVRIRLDGVSTLYIFRIDRFGEFQKKYDRKEQELLRFAVMKIINEILASFFYCETVDMHTDHIAAIVQPKGDNAESYGIECNIEDTIERIRKTCLEYLELSVSCTIGRRIDSYENINLSYNESMNYSNYRLISGHGCLIRVEEAEKREYTVAGSSDVLDRYSLLIDAIKLGKNDSARKIYKEASGIIRGMSYSDIILSYMRLAIDIFNVVNVIEANGMIKLGLNYHTFIRDISNMETMDEIDGCFLALIDMIAEKVNEIRDGSKKNRRIVNEMTDIINEKYLDANLSVDILAESFNLSPSYLGRIFRKTTGLSVSDYINKVRIEKFRTLLLESGQNIDEIAESVGIKNTKYLFTIFRKEYGVTPREFRLKNANHLPE